MKKTTLSQDYFEQTKKEPYGINNVPTKEYIEWLEKQLLSYKEVTLPKTMNRVIQEGTNDCFQPQYKTKYGSWKNYKETGYDYRDGVDYEFNRTYNTLEKAWLFIDGETNKNTTISYYTKQYIN